MEKSKKFDVIASFNKEDVIGFYEKLLDLTEQERMSERYPEWCELERMFVELFGEKTFRDHYLNPEGREEIC